MTFADAVALTSLPDAHSRAQRYVQACLRLAGRSNECVRLFKATGEMRWYRRATLQTTAAMRLLRWAKEHSRR